MSDSPICLNCVRGFVYHSSKWDQNAAYSCWITRYALWPPLSFLMPAFYNSHKKGFQTISATATICYILKCTLSCYSLQDTVSWVLCTFLLRENSFFSVPFPSAAGRQKPEYLSFSPYARSYPQMLSYKASLLEKDKNCKPWPQMMQIQRSQDWFYVFLNFLTFLLFKNGMFIGVTIFSVAFTC